jgi:hypothetical protein
VSRISSTSTLPARTAAAEDAALDAQHATGQPRREDAVLVVLDQHGAQREVPAFRPDRRAMAVEMPRAGQGQIADTNITAGHDEGYLRSRSGR